MQFTADQRRVIDLRNCNILVSAAAGSGKTAVLVERILELVGDEENGTDIDRLLVVTFTNAAASQMRERITQALSERIDREPDNGHLQRQLTLINNAQITTIDSFCLYVIRNHFNEIGLDPDFRTADDAESRLLEQDVLEELLEFEFQQADPAFINCVESFAPGGKEGRLEELILTLYEFAMSYPWPEEWLTAHRGDYGESKAREKEPEWLSLLMEMARATLGECREQAGAVLRLCGEPDGPYMYAPALESDLCLTEELLSLCGGQPAEPDGLISRMEALYQRLSAFSLVRLPVKKDDSVSQEKRERAKKERERVKNLLGGLKEKFFYASPERFLSDMANAEPALQELVDLTLSFKERLDSKKREKNLLDFHDMEHLALQILLEKTADGEVTPSRAALEYREHFREILIDEYQDSNLVQELLLRSIAAEEEGRFNRFMVGDVKQSIYKFRLARPELFMEKADAYSKEDGSCVRVDLKQNFRSRHEVTDCVNDIFSRVMHRGLGGVEYDADAALYPAARFPEPEKSAEKDGKGAAADGEEEGHPAANGGNVYEAELLTAVSREDGMTDRQREAAMIADRIHSLVGSLPVRDAETGGLRPARYRDIVILLRSAAGWDEELKKVLTEEGIPVHVTSRTGYFAAPEVQTVLNFLRVLNNPLSDIPLFGVMKAPFAGFDDGQIAAVRSLDNTGKMSLYDCVKLAAREAGEPGSPKGGADSAIAVPAEKCRELLSFINRFRGYAVYMPIHNLIESFLSETGFLYTVSAMPGGAQRAVNVEMLLARAENYEKTSYTGLFHFVRYMEQMEKYNIDYGEAGELDENADIVRIMTIHKSKGLEFPVCFVAGLSRRFNRQESAQPVIMDMDLGLAVDFVDPEARTRRSTIKKNVLAQKLRQDSLGEELRVLYVAMTRAEEKLILTASCKEEKLPGDTTAGHTAMSCVALMEAGSFYDILINAWLASGRPVRCVNAADFVSEELVRRASGNNDRNRLLFSDRKDRPDPMVCGKLRDRLMRPYAHENLSGLFVKTTVSELKKAGMQEDSEAAASLFEEEEVIPYLPRFIKKEDRRAGGAFTGSAYHRALELFPFERKEITADWTVSEIESALMEEQESGALPAEYAPHIRPEKIAAFLKSPLAQRMRAAQALGLLKREQPFVLGIPASSLREGLPAEETVLIQGIIDVFFEEEGGLVVADYKTDAVKAEAELVRRYRVQLEYYAKALEQMTELKVKEKILYSFALGRQIVL